MKSSMGSKSCCLAAGMGSRPASQPKFRGQARLPMGPFCPLKKTALSNQASAAVLPGGITTDVVRSRPFALGLSAITAGIFSYGGVLFCHCAGLPEWATIGNLVIGPALSAWTVSSMRKYALDRAEHATVLVLPVSDYISKAERVEHAEVTPVQVMVDGILHCGGDLQSYFIGEIWPSQKQCGVEKVSIDWKDGISEIPLDTSRVVSREDLFDFFDGAVAVNVYLNA